MRPLSGNAAYPIVLHHFQGLRQRLLEINPDMHEVLLAEDGQNVEVYRAGDMLPHAYHRERTPVPNPAPPTSDNPDPLIAQALIARSRSFVPRTNEPVGAAVETMDGHIYTGIRVETSSFSTQAERVAMANAIRVAMLEVEKGVPDRIGERVAEVFARRKIA